MLPICAVHVCSICMLDKMSHYLDLHPPPFLVRVQGCTLYSNSKYDFTNYDDDYVAYYHPTVSDQDNSIKLSVSEVVFLPCKTNPHQVLKAVEGDIEKYVHNELNEASVTAFDIRNVIYYESILSVILSSAVIFMLIIMAVFLGKEMATLTEVIVSPLTKLAQEMDRVSRFDLKDTTTPPPNGDTSAVGLFSSSHAKQMVKSLAKNAADSSNNQSALSSIEEVRSIEKSFSTMKTTIQSFAKYVPQDVVNQMVRAKSGVAQLSVQEQEATVLFSDIENFTKICECLGVGDKLLKLMSDYFTAMSDIIHSTGGCLLEFIGDAVLAVWNAPNPEEMHAVQAVTAALEMHSYLHAMRESWDEKGYPRVRIRCGIHTAKVLVGNIGAPNRMK
jgi:hypothetical protein